MRRLSYEEFLGEREAFEDALRKTEGVARFCSNIPWQCAAREHLVGFDFGIPHVQETLIVERNGNWLVFTERNDGVFFPFESAWMFGCPLIGEAGELVSLLRDAARKYFPGVCGYVVSGMLEDSDLHRELLNLRGSSVKFQEFETTDCMTIDLSEGADAYLARRSRSFRKGLRQMKEIDLTIVDGSGLDPDLAFERILAIQHRSYKSKSGADIFSDPRYEDFYRDLYLRLYRDDRIRLLFGEVEGEDIAYILGGIFDDIYRGFQMSYDNRFRSYSPGNRLQLENLRRMAGEGIRHYDLGMHSDYKERWADHRERYRGVFVVL